MLISFYQQNLLLIKIYAYNVNIVDRIQCHIPNMSPSWCLVRQDHLNLLLILSHIVLLLLTYFSKSFSLVIGQWTAQIICLIFLLLSWWVILFMVPRRWFRWPFCDLPSVFDNLYISFYLLLLIGAKLGTHFSNLVFLM